MNHILSIVSAFALALTLLFLAGPSLIYGQQNQTDNMTTGAMNNQTNQTGIGTAEQIESLTPPTGGIGQQQEGGQSGIMEGLEKQTENETIGGLQGAGNATGEILETVGNETGEFLGNISEGVQDIFN